MRPMGAVGEKEERGRTGGSDGFPHVTPLTGCLKIAQRRNPHNSDFISTESRVTGSAVMESEYQTADPYYMEHTTNRSLSYANIKESSFLL